MNAKDLFHMLGDIGASGVNLADIKLVTKDGRSISGVWTEIDKKRIILVQPDKRAEKRVDL